MGATVKEIPAIGVGAGVAANAEDGRIPCSSGDCNSGGPPDFLGGCSNGVCTGTDGTAHDCLCACIPPDAPQSCPAAAMVNKMSTMEFATAKIPEQGWISMPAIAVGVGVAAAFGFFVALQAKRRSRSKSKTVSSHWTTTSRLVEM